MKDNYNTDSKAICGEHDAEMRGYAELARAARARHEVSAPDTEKEWDTFSAGIAAERLKPSQRRFDWRTLRGIAIGAAAMFAIMLAYNQYFPKDQTERNKKEITAMRDDNSPQSVTLQNANTKQSLSVRDSMSFVAAAANGNTDDGSVAGIDKKTQSAATPMQKLSTPRGMDFKVILPDGSEVWLNAESTIEFPSAFTGAERRVSLKGEAYFKVARNESQPFIVSTDKVAVKVLGTEFNLKNYKEETLHVSLVKGKVEVLQGEDGGAATTLKPGQDAWMDDSGSMHVREIDTYAVTQWIRGFFYFDDTALVDILRELSRWYNCGVVFNNRSRMETRLHFSASREAELGQTIENLNKLCKFKITIEDGNLVVN